MSKEETDRSGHNFMPVITADEYRLLADMLLNHIGTNSLSDDHLEDLANRLYLTAVKAGHTDSPHT